MTHQNRPEPPDSAAELVTLTGFLDYLRATAVRKATGLGDADAAHRLLWRSSPNYQRACMESREVLARYALDGPCHASPQHNVRWVVVHMIEETGGTAVISTSSGNA